MMCSCGHDLDDHYHGMTTYCDVAGCMCIKFVEDLGRQAQSAPPAPTNVAPSSTLSASSTAVREATEAEDHLIQLLSVAIGHRLLRDWQELPQHLRVLPMGLAFLAAICHSLGRCLASTAAQNAEDVEGWEQLVAQSLEIVQCTAVAARDGVLTRDPLQRDPKEQRAMVPEPKSIM